MKILIAEDNITMASALRYILQQMGHNQITETNDGGDALRLLSKNHFDLVIMDWALPSVNGVSLTKWMRQKESYSRTPVIMVTSKDQPEDVLTAVESGVNEYVLKPVDKEILRAKINKVLGINEVPAP